MVRRYDTYRWSSGGLVQLGWASLGRTITGRAGLTSEPPRGSHKQWWLSCRWIRETTGWKGVAQGRSAGATTITAYSGVAELPEPRGRRRAVAVHCTSPSRRGVHGPWPCSLARFGLADARQKRCSGRSTQGALQAPRCRCPPLLR